MILKNDFWFVDRFLESEFSRAKFWLSGYFCIIPPSFDFLTDFLKLFDFFSKITMPILRLSGQSGTRFGDLLCWSCLGILLTRKGYGFRKVKFLNFWPFLLTKFFDFSLQLNQQIWDERFNRNIRLRDFFLQKLQLLKFWAANYILSSPLWCVTYDYVWLYMLSVITPMW